MLFRRLIALAGLDALTVPVQIVQLELHKLHLRVRGQHLVQKFGGVVEGKAHVPDQALLLLLPQPVVAVVLLIHLVVQGPHVVDQVVVKVVNAGFFKLGFEYFVPVLERMDIVRMELGGQGVAVSGVAVRKGGLYRALALIAAVHPGRVKIGEAPLNEHIHHLLELLYVNARFIVWVQSGQAHQSEAKFFCHDRLPPFFLYYIAAAGACQTHFKKSLIALFPRLW